jgi:hypothetical protein
MNFVVTAIFLYTEGRNEKGENTEDSFERHDRYHNETYSLMKGIMW